MADSTLAPVTMETLAEQNREILKEVRDLRGYVEKIEQEAHEAMGGLTDPDNMMKMAGQFLGMPPG